MTNQTPPHENFLRTPLRVDSGSCNACPSRLLLLFYRGTFRQKAL